MIIDVFMEKLDDFSRRIDYYFIDSKTEREVAKATKYVDECATLFYDFKKIEVTTDPHMITKRKLNAKYPITPNIKRTIGFPVYIDEHLYLNYYQEAFKVKKGFIVNKNIVFTAFDDNDDIYSLFRVGFNDENSYYFCMYNNTNQTVAIIKRHVPIKKNGCKATIYVEEDKYLQLALIACTEEMIAISNTGTRDVYRDPTGGPYVSLLEEEKELFDKNFLERVKQDS